MHIVTPTGQKTIEVAFHTVTPEMARLWLNSPRPVNRTIRPNKVADIARAIRTGRWEPANGEAIKFDAEGCLIDGQHRLSAVIEAGVPVCMLVIGNVGIGAMRTVDIGESRRGADVLKVEDQGGRMKNYAVLAAAATWLWKIRRGSAGIKDSRRPSKDEIPDIVSRNPGLVECANELVRSRGLRAMAAKAPFLSALYYVFRQIDEEDAQSFMRKFGDGLGLEQGDPVYILRERFLTDRAEQVTTRTWMQVALVVRAWNAHHEGRKVQFLRVSAEQPFPDIVGWNMGASRPFAAK